MANQRGKQSQKPGGQQSKRNRPSNTSNENSGSRPGGDRTILILGAPGLVGSQVTRQVARELCPEQMILASLSVNDFGTFVDDLRQEMREYAAKTEREAYRQIKFIEVAGNIFVHQKLARVSSKELRDNPGYRGQLFDDLFGPLTAAQENSYLVQIIKRYKPDVIIDCINTATGISYQDVDTGCKDIQKQLNQIRESQRDKTVSIPAPQYKALEDLVEMLLISQSMPQLARHIQLLHQAMRDHGTRLYIKIGTTGTGGMGLNIPYTHGEEQPSAKLMAKSSIGFAHTGLMFLMARTPGGPIVKEIKPGAMIGYKKVVYQELKKHRKYKPKDTQLAHRLELDLPTAEFEEMGPIMMVGVDTGENGFFARGEFEAVTSINQMEFVTPEEIAGTVVLEIKGSNTGHDVIAAIDGAVMPPSYRAGYLRASAIESLLREQEQYNPHSVATGELGPPKLTKLLYEAYLLHRFARDFDPSNTPKLQVILDHDPKEIANSLENYLSYNQDLRDTIISIGIPILLMDGETLLRGPHINVPEGEARDGFSQQDINDWADQGWLDLRPENIRKWQTRFQKMLESARMVHLHGSAEITMEAYRSTEIRIGEVVGWIFNNEVRGYRIK
jgi:hypothetical protein